MYKAIEFIIIRNPYETGSSMQWILWEEYRTKLYRNINNYYTKLTLCQDSQHN